MDNRGRPADPTSLVSIRPSLGRSQCRSCTNYHARCARRAHNNSRIRDTHHARNTHPFSDSHQTHGSCQTRYGRQTPGCRLTRDNLPVQPRTRANCMQSAVPISQPYCKQCVSRYRPFLRKVFIFFRCCRGLSESLMPSIRRARQKSVYTGCPIILLEQFYCGSFSLFNDLDVLYWSWYSCPHSGGGYCSLAVSEFARCFHLMASVVSALRFGRS